ncbi:ROK family protein [Chitinophaga cymbidii]|uniref:Transcriptional regulator n=1 Tax=Chitinophaga cymbidii TaxID=1096750 RepID=A0A512RJN6_9BACT|nr:ROK family protein [Chitinophaga cymbidii]GEP95882.1 transcriptional regulator [Chitinophaga cymbidii]
MVNKSYYKALALREFYFSGKLSSTDLSVRMGKSIPHVLKIIDDLIADGSIAELGYAPSSGGRRPIIYALKPDAIYILSVGMDQEFTRIALMDIENNPVAQVKEFELPLTNNPEAIVRLKEKMQEVIKESGVSKDKIIGAGIGMPGFVDFKKGVNYSFLNAGGKTITEYLTSELNIPVYIDNDSSLIALAEFRFGAARQKKNAMVVNIGWGIGLGMILNGELFRGHDGFAGEFSHIPLFNNNKLCSCGKSGCLETEASLLLVIEKAGHGLKDGRLSALGAKFPTGHPEADWDAIVKAAHKGDRFVVELLSKTGYDIGKAVAILIHLMNPEFVILSGRGTLAGKVWEAPVQQALNEHSIPRLAANTKLAISTLGHHAELIGAVSLVMENKVKEFKTSRKKVRVREFSHD